MLLFLLEALILPVPLAVAAAPLILHAQDYFSAHIGSDGQVHLEPPGSVCSVASEYEGAFAHLGARGTARARRCALRERVALESLCSFSLYFFDLQLGPAVAQCRAEAGGSEAPLRCSAERVLRELVRAPGLREQVRALLGRAVHGGAAPGAGEALLGAECASPLSEAVFAGPQLYEWPASFLKLHWRYTESQRRPAADAPFPDEHGTARLLYSGLHLSLRAVYAMKDLTGFWYGGFQGLAARLAAHWVTRALVGDRVAERLAALPTRWQVSDWTDRATVLCSLLTEYAVGTGGEPPRRPLRIAEIGVHEGRTPARLLGLEERSAPQGCDTLTYGQHGFQYHLVDLWNETRSEVPAQRFYQPNAALHGTTSAPPATSDGEVYATMLRRVRSALRRGTAPAAHVVTVGAARAGATNRSVTLRLQRVEADDARGGGSEAVDTGRARVPSHWTGIFVHRAMSAEEAAPRFASRFFDLVFIDGDHTADGVRRDLAAWAPRTRGVLAGHDYNPAGYPGLLQALYAWKDADTEFRHPLTVDADYTWWTVRGG